ncbi:MAG: hypothetical protein P4L64_03405 [Caulobacteraceae bacterium]|nr:hypothetical protein [Caulobacteraceae bacterium]
MKNSIAIAAGIVGSFLIAGSSLADGGFQAHMTQCVDKFASASDSASVVLECSAAEGKLSDCKVVENSAAGKGFDKAALCVASFLPIGSKTGTIRVPLKFQGA